MSPQFLIGTHAAIGEAGSILFLWALIELLNPTEARIKRAKSVILWGAILLFAAWVVGGYYYVQFYGANVKPIIKAGPQAWAHGIITETKEHVFLFLPFLALLALGVIKKKGSELIADSGTRKALIALCALIVIVGFAMATMGFIISSGFRSALETKL